MSLFSPIRGKRFRHACIHSMYPPEPYWLSLLGCSQAPRSQSIDCRTSSSLLEQNRISTVGSSSLRNNTIVILLQDLGIVFHDLFGSARLSHTDVQ